MAGSRSNPCVSPLLLGLILSLFCSESSRSAGPGTAFGEGLRLTNTAWAIGMSDAMVASGEGVSAISLNPAGVLDGSITTIHLTHAFYVEKLWEDYFAYSQRLPFGSAFGVSLHGIYDNSTPRTLEDANGNYAGEAGTYPLGFAVGGASYALNLASLIGALDVIRPTGGVGLRGVWQQIDRKTYLGITADAGFKFRPGAGLVVGGVLQNIGTVTGPSGLPLQWVMGVGWRGSDLAIAHDRVLVEVDSPIAVDRDFSLRVGAEYGVVVGKVSVAVRGGWKQENEVPGAPGISGGVGFRWFLGRTPWGMDYAFVPWGVFGGVHAISITLGIVPRQPVASPPPPAPDRSPPEVFYPLKGETARYALSVANRTELSAVLLDVDGHALATLFARRIVEPGEYQITWNGLLPNGMMADFDRVFRILIQAGGEAWYKDVMPKKE